MFSEIPPLLFSQPSYQYCDVTWPLLLSFSIPLSLLIVVFFILLCLQSAAYDSSLFFHLLSLFFLFISCLWPPHVRALLLPQNICLLDQLLPYPPTSFNSSCASCWLFYKTFFVVCCLFSISWFIGMVVCFQSPRLIHLLHYMYNGHWEAWDLLADVCPVRWVSCPVFSNSKQFFSLSRIPIKCQRVREWEEVGAKESLSCSGREFKMRQWVHSCGLGLEELSGGVGMGGIWVVECKFWNVGGLLQVCGLWFVEEFQNLVPEFVCLGSWFWNLIIFKSFKFSNFLIRVYWFPPKLYPEMRSGGKYF